MNSLRERLRDDDPACAARPLDADEVAGIRRAMAAARPEPRRWSLAAGLALAATVVLAAVLLWPQAPPASAPVPVPLPLAVVPAPSTVAPVAPAPALLAAEVRAARRRPAVLPPMAPPEPAQVKEIRFVTANGTQILWTVRSSEEGA
jgi:hypothetical protein